MIDFQSKLGSKKLYLCVGQKKWVCAPHLKRDTNWYRVRHNATILAMINFSKEPFNGSFNWLKVWIHAAVYIRPWCVAVQLVGHCGHCECECPRSGGLLTKPASDFMLSDAPVLYFRCTSQWWGFFGFWRDWTNWPIVISVYGNEISFYETSSTIFCQKRVKKRDACIAEDHIFAK